MVAVAFTARFRTTLSTVMFPLPLQVGTTCLTTPRWAGRAGRTPSMPSPSTQAYSTSSEWASSAAVFAVEILKPALQPSGRSGAWDSHLLCYLLEILLEASYLPALALCFPFPHLQVLETPTVHHFNLLLGAPPCLPTFCYVASKSTVLCVGAVHRANERSIRLMERITDRLMKEQAWDQVRSGERQPGFGIPGTLLFLHQ